jgi:glycosyltransferase involved in cell wall biosynthesis
MNSGPHRVLLMSQFLGAGGTERQLAEIAKGLDRSRFQPHVGCFYPEGLRFEELREAGVPVLALPVRSLYKPATLAAARQMGRYVKERGITLVHTYDVPTNIFGIPAAKACRVPVILSSQRAHRDLTPGIYRKLLRVTDHMVDGIVVNSRAVERQLIKEDGVPAATIRLCYNGIDTRIFHPCGRAADSVLTIGSVSLLRPEKGQKTLIEAFAKVCAERPNIKLVLVGGGPMQSDLEQLVSTLGVTENCRFEPATQSVADWLRRFDIFVLPSLSEALSNSLMEAMACASCPIASAVGGNPELVTDGQTGLLFRAGDSDDLAAKLRLVIDNADLRRNLAQNAAAFIKETFSLQSSIHRMQEIYSEALERRFQ